MSDAKPAPAEETKPRRRFSGWKIAGIALGVLFVIGLVFYFWINSVADRRWAELEKRVAELLVETRGRDGTREALRGETVPGSAWEDYELALAEARKFKGSNAALGDYISKNPKADRTKVEAVLAAHSVALDHLRRGARRANGQYPVAWEDGFNAKIPGLLESQMLANLAGCQARFLAEAGKHNEAVELLTDTARFGRDLGSNSMLISEMIGIAVMGIAYDELRTMILSGKLKGEPLARLSKELEILDRTFVQHGPVMVNEVLGMGEGFRKTGMGEVTGGDVPALLVGGWRYGFSGRLMIVDAFFSHERAMRKVAECEAMTWGEARKIMDDYEKEAKAAKNILSQIMAPGLSQTGRTVRERRAHVRLLRAAAHYQQTGEVLEVDDPLGAKILSSRAGTKLTLWSVGRDGQDDGGVGEWGPGKGKDIVLEVER